MTCLPTAGAAERTRGRGGVGAGRGSRGGLRPAGAGLAAPLAATSSAPAERLPCGGHLRSRDLCDVRVRLFSAWFE